MYILRGKQISRGISIGKLLSYHKQKSNIQKINIENVAFEVQRFRDAQILSVGQLKVLYEQAVQRVGQKEALIFGMHQMLIEDVEFTEESLKEFIKTKSTDNLFPSLMCI